MYSILPIEEFGRELIVSGDLDPVYLMLNKADLDLATKARWCLAYWCLYHCGSASAIADDDGADFWNNLNSAALNEGRVWPRGKERRHWRAANAYQSFLHLKDRYAEDPSAFALAFPEPENPEDSIPFSEVSEWVRTHVGFGPWMAFKVGDMLEQCFGVPIDFSEAEVFMFSEPKEAAFLLWRQRTGQPAGAVPRDLERVIREIVAYLTQAFADLRAPNGKRPIGLQEVETVLCKWKSHCNGHYPLYNDLREIRTALLEWSGVSPVAKKLLEAFPQLIRGRAD